MSLLLAFLAAAGIDPEVEAVMGRRKTPEERRMRTHTTEGPKASIDPALEDCVDLARRAVDRTAYFVSNAVRVSARPCCCPG